MPMAGAKYGVVTSWGTVWGRHAQPACGTGDQQLGGALGTSASSTGFLLQAHQ